MDSLPPHPAIDRPDKCGVTEVINGHEWICIKDVHDPEYRRRQTDRAHFGYVHGTGAHPERPFGKQAAPADRHVMVRRWPNTDR